MTADVRCDHRDAASVTNLRSPPAVGSSATVELHASNACCCIGQRGGDGDDFAVHPIAAVMTGVLMAAAVRSRRRPPSVPWVPVTASYRKSTCSTTNQDTTVKW